MSSVTAKLQKTVSDMIAKAGAFIVPRPSVIRMSLSKLSPNPCQTPNRTSLTALMELLRRVLRQHYITPPQVSESVDEHGYRIIIDGHRRIAVARLLGITHLWCVIVPAKNGRKRDHREGFMDGTAAQKAFDGRTWLMMLHQERQHGREADVLKCMTDSTRARVNYLIKIMGTDEFYTLLPFIHSPLIVQQYDTVMRGFKGQDLSFEPVSLMRWLVICGSSAHVKALRTLKPSDCASRLTALWKCYRHGVPYDIGRSRQTGVCLSTTKCKTCKSHVRNIVTVSIAA